MNLNASNVVQNGVAILTALGLKILGAIVLFMIGRWLIRLATNLTARALDRQGLDRTIVAYIRSGIRLVLNIVLIVAILGYFGIQTASFAALLVGVGLAVGAAWSGLLSNFAAGLFLLVLRPFKVSDYVEAGGVTGTVEAIGLFATTLNTPENVIAIVGNAKIFGDTIRNFTRNDYRRVDLTAQLSHDVDPKQAIMILRDGIARIPNVLPKPAPVVEILSFTLAGPVLAVRPFCANEHYWQVYFDTNALLRDTFAHAGYPVPEQHFAFHGKLERTDARAMSKAA